MYAEFNVEAMVRGDFQAQTEGWTKLLEKGPLSINDVRGMLNMNPVEGGDSHNVQLNMRDVAEAAAKAAGASETKHASETAKMLAVGIDLIAKAVEAAGNRPAPTQHIEVHPAAVNMAPASVSVNAITPRGGTTPFDVLTGGKKTVKIKRNSRGLMESAEIETIYEDRASGE
jgi:hypothetical protein